MYKDFYKTLSKNDKIPKQYFSEEEVLEMIIDVFLEKTEKSKYEPEILEKGLKNAFKAGLTVLGMLHGAHYMNSPKAKPEMQQQKQVDYNKIREDARRESSKGFEERDNKINSFLNAISLNESSGGKNLNHKKMKRGMHTGDSAVGSYGLMPNTVKEMAVRMGEKHPLSHYSKMDSKSISSSIKNNPEHEKQIAGFMANHLHDKFGGDEHKMAYSWNQGHNISPEDFNDKHKGYLDHDYTKKYSKNKQLSQPPKQPPNTQANKQ